MATDSRTECRLYVAACVCVCVCACVCQCVMSIDTLQLIGCWGAAVDPSLSGVSLYSCTHPKSIYTHECENTHTLLLFYICEVLKMYFRVKIMFSSPISKIQPWTYTQYSFFNWTSANSARIYSKVRKNDIMTEVKFTLTHTHAISGLLMHISESMCVVLLWKYSQWHRDS